MRKTPKQLTGSFTFKAVLLFSAVVLMTVTMPASASTGADIDGPDRGTGPHVVPVCHNGSVIFVSLSAVPAHLAHGDILGNSCDITQ